MEKFRRFRRGVVASMNMLTRRTILAGAAASFLKGDMTAVNFEIPANACDSHTHIFGDSAKFPMSPARGYTPEPASVAEMRALHRQLHMDRVVIVQPSIYGTDNSCTLDAIKQLGRRARGIAVIDEKTNAA